MRPLPITRAARRGTGSTAHRQAHRSSRYGPSRLSPRSVRLIELMALASDVRKVEFGPWNPGLESRIPDQLRPLSTIFRPENVFTTFDSARELRDLTGLDYRD